MRENAHHSQELPIAAQGWSRHSSVDDEQLHCASPEFHSFLSLCLSVSLFLSLSLLFITIIITAILVFLLKYFILFQLLSCSYVSP